MTDIIGDTSCPDCRAEGGDTTGNHLMLFSDGGGYCNRCGYTETSGTFTESRVDFGTELTPEALQGQVQEASEHSVLKTLTDRGISKETCEYYGVRCYLSTTDGKTVTAVLFPSDKDNVTQGYKLRIEGKRFGKAGTTKGGDFFGANAVPKTGRKLFITEGEYDAMALRQCMKARSKKEWVENIAVVSLANGSGSVKTEFGRNSKLLDGYNEIVLCFDMDKAGEEAVEAAVAVLGRDKCKRAVLDLKDANEMLLAGKGKELYWACVGAKATRPASIVTLDSMYESILVRPEMGLSFPWPTLTKLTYGIRKGVTYIVGAAPKIGKTDFEYELIKHLIKVHNVKVSLYDLENNPVQSAKKIAGKVSGKMFHKPTTEYKDEELIAALDQLNGNIEFYRHNGSRDWEDIIKTIRYQASNGCWLFVIDTLTSLVSRYSSSDANDRLNTIMTDIAEMNTELDITFFLFSHVNPHKVGRPHDEGGKVLSSQFTGSRAMEKWGHYGIGLWRDRSAEDEVVRNTSTHGLLFDRLFGEFGTYECFYDRDTGAYSEIVEGVNAGVNADTNAGIKF